MRGMSPKERKLLLPFSERGIDREPLMRSRMEIMCHQTAVGREPGEAPHKPLPPACRQELGTAHPEALTSLNGQADPPRPPY